jgi:hypothetical protein
MSADSNQSFGVGADPSGPIGDSAINDSNLAGSALSPGRAGADLAVVPEPSSLVLFAVRLVSLSGAAIRRMYAGCVKTGEISIFCE